MSEHIDQRDPAASTYLPPARGIPRIKFGSLDLHRRARGQNAAHQMHHWQSPPQYGNHVLYDGQHMFKGQQDQRLQKMLKLGKNNIKYLTSAETAFP